MFLTFIATVSVGLVCTVLTLLTMQKDTETKAIRTFIILVIAMGAWFASISTFQATSQVIISYPAYNVVTPSGTVQYPAFNQTITYNNPMAGITFNTYLYLWIFILFIHLALLILYLYGIGEGNIMDGIRAIRGT